VSGAGYRMTHFHSHILAVASSDSSTTVSKTATRFDSEDSLQLLAV